MADDESITRLLDDLDAGEAGAMDRLMEAVYADLERVACKKLAEAHGSDGAGVTLEPAALVNESFLRLAKQRKGFANREQFFAIATRIMIRVLRDAEDRRAAAKRGGGARPVTLCVEDLTSNELRQVDASWMDFERWAKAIDALGEMDPRKAEGIRLKVFFGLTMQEIAETLGISLATAERDWAFSRAWLGREIRRGSAPENEGIDASVPREE